MMTRPTMHHLSVNAVRAEALFVSTVQRSEGPGVGRVRDAVAAAVRQFGVRGCAQRVAQEFGDHPESAVARMRWARQVVDEAFGDAGPRHTHARLFAQRFVAHTGCAA